MADKKLSALSAGSSIADADVSYWAQGAASVKQPASAIWTYIQTKLGTGVATALGIAPNTTGGVALTTVTPTAWTPTDQSGASLIFTSVSAQYCQYGNLVFVYGTLTYPSTADGSNAKISLPVAVPNQPYARIVSSNMNVLANTGLETVINSSTAAVFNTGTGAATLNSAMSLKVLNFILIYPAS